MAVARSVTKMNQFIFFIIPERRPLTTGKLTGIPCSDAQNDLTNVHTGDGAVGLAESTTHTGLESIGSGARQHLVDTDDVVRVGAHAEMETFLSCDLDEVPARAAVRNYSCEMFLRVPPFSNERDYEIEAYYGLSPRHLCPYAQSLPFQGTKSH